MKVWVVIEGYDYEGFDEPRKVFDTERKASDYILSKPDCKYNYWNYFELEVE